MVFFGRRRPPLVLLRRGAAYHSTQNPKKLPPPTLFLLPPVSWASSPPLLFPRPPHTGNRGPFVLPLPPKTPSSPSVIGGGRWSPVFFSVFVRPPFFRVSSFARPFLCRLPSGLPLSAFIPVIAPQHRSTSVCCRSPHVVPPPCQLQTLDNLGFPPVLFFFCRVPQPFFARPCVVLPNAPPVPSFPFY